MRGYIDGDGCFCKAQNKNQKPHISFSMRGTCEFLRQFNKILIDADVVREEHTIIPKDGKKYAAFDTLKYGGNILCNRLYDFLYNNATIYLERKKNIIEQARGLICETRKSNGKISKEMLLENAKELRSQKKVAEFFNCTSANITYLSKRFNIKTELFKAFGKFSKEEILNLYNLLGTCSLVSKHTGLTSARIYQIIKEVSDANII
jgi:hypothetical protein